MQTCFFALLCRYRSEREYSVTFERSPSEFWRFCSSNLARDHASFPLPMVHATKSISDLRNLRKAFNSFFTSNFSTLTPVFHRSNSNNHVPLLSSLYFLPNNVLAPFLKLLPNITAQMAFLATSLKNSLLC
jgi:hypothetical protein